MAASLIPFRSVGISACATSGNRKSDAYHRKQPSSNWWSPLFGWSSDPDYIDSSTNNTKEKIDFSTKSENRSESDTDPKPSMSRFPRSTFTAEKAKQLRLMMNDTASYHDAMYHSAIASRLASDFSNRSDH